MEKDLPYRVVTPPPRHRLSDSIASQVEELIVQGALRPGAELPAERLLWLRFGASRPPLREALLRFEARGLLKITRAGRFTVTDVTAPAMTDPLVHLLRRYPCAEQDVLEMRHGLEMVAAQIRCRTGHARGPGTLRRAFDHPVKTADGREALADAQADADFTSRWPKPATRWRRSTSCAACTTCCARACARRGRSCSRSRRTSPCCMAPHRALLDAVLAGGVDRARNSVHLHLSYDPSSLQQLVPPPPPVPAARRTVPPRKKVLPTKAPVRSAAR